MTRQPSKKPTEPEGSKKASTYSAVASSDLKVAIINDSIEFGKLKAEQAGQKKQWPKEG